MKFIKHYKSVGHAFTIRVMQAFAGFLASSDDLKDGTSVVDNFSFTMNVLSRNQKINFENIFFIEVLLMI